MPSTAYNGPKPHLSLFGRRLLHCSNCIAAPQPVRSGSERFPAPPPEPSRGGYRPPKPPQKSASGAPEALLGGVHRGA
eukprot:14420836-Alexandrium_andersonii.AAC.1